MFLNFNLYFLILKYIIISIDSEFFLRINPANSQMPPPHPANAFAVGRLCRLELSFLENLVKFRANTRPIPIKRKRKISILMLYTPIRCVYYRIGENFLATDLPEI
jgi:hypothetical protein